MSRNGVGRPGLRERRRVHGRCRSQLGAGRRGHGRADRRRRHRRRRPQAGRTGHRGRRPRRTACWCRGSRTPTCIPVGGGLDMLQCDLHDLSTPEEYLPRSGPTPTAHPEAPWILGGGWSMDVVPGGTPTKDGARSHRARPAASTCPTATATAPGSTRARSRSAGVTRDTPDPADGRIERDAEGEPSGTLHEGAGDLVDRPSRRSPPRTTWPRACARARRTSIRSASRPGRTRSSTTISSVATTSTPTSRAAERRASSPPGWSARSGGTATGASSRSTTWSTLRARGRGGPVRRDQRQDHAGRRLRELHGGGARALPRRRTAQPTDNRGISFVDPQLLNEAVTRLDAARASRCTSTRSPSGRCARRSTRSKRR